MTSDAEMSTHVYACAGSPPRAHIIPTCRRCVPCVDTQVSELAPVYRRTVGGEDWALVALAARATGALTFSCDIAYSDSPAPSTGVLSTPIWR